MKTIFVGIDISKNWLDYSLSVEKKSDPTPSERIKNDVKEISRFVNKLSRKHGSGRLWFCFEHTGNYGLLLSSILQSNGIKYSAVPALEIKRSIGLTRGKTDQIDAQRIAQYAATFEHKLKATELPSNELLEVKNLLAYHSQLVKIKTQFQNSHKSYQTAQQVVDLEYINEDLIRKIEQLKNDIKRIDEKIKSIINESDDLQKNYNLISSVKGVGIVLAAFMLVYTNNFTSFDDPRKFNCFTGLAPFENSSGLTNKATRTSFLRHKYLKSLIFNGAHSAAQFDPQLKKYYERKRAEGKAHLTVINAIGCKLVYRAFATERRQSPYVILNH